MYLPVFDLIFRVFVPKNRSTSCSIRKFLFALFYRLSLFRTHVNLGGLLGTKQAARYDWGSLQGGIECLVIL